jgi:hypothetical protein
MSWWLCAAGVRLSAQVNSRFPRRDHGSDGAVGDTSHSARRSDHNPDPTSEPPGVVRAIDLDEDFTTSDDPLANTLAEQLVELGPKEERLSYVIFEGRIASRARGWQWRRYSGPNAHLHHIHVSFTPAGDRDGRPFGVPVLRNPPTATEDSQ